MEPGRRAVSEVMQAGVATLETKERLDLAQHVMQQNAAESRSVSVMRPPRQ